MFVDEVSVKLIAGKGGDGCTAFRREKYIAMGGPNGGNGGKGADIIFVADESLRTLIDLKMQKIINTALYITLQKRKQQLFHLVLYEFLLLHLPGQQEELVFYLPIILYYLLYICP